MAKLIERETYSGIYDLSAEEMSSDDCLHFVWRAQQHLWMHDPYPRQVSRDDEDAIDILHECAKSPRQ